LADGVLWSFFTNVFSGIYQEEECKVPRIKKGQLNLGRFVGWFWLLVSCGLVLSCGGGGGGDVSLSPPVSIAARTLLVTPALGGFSAGAKVELITSAGVVFGEDITNAEGNASPLLGDFSAPFIVRVTGAPGVSFFNERSRTQDPFPSEARLLAVVPGFSALTTSPSIGVNPLTNAAASILVANPLAPRITLGLSTNASPEEIQKQIASANARVAVVFGLDPAVSILTRPRVRRTASDLLDSTDRASLQLGVLLTALALAAPDNDLLAQANALASESRLNNGALPLSAALTSKVADFFAKVLSNLVPSDSRSCIRAPTPDPTLSRDSSSGAIERSVEIQINLATGVTAPIPAPLPCCPPGSTQLGNGPGTAAIVSTSTGTFIGEFGVGLPALVIRTQVGTVFCSR
jgi:hypothetical protein